MKISQLMKTLEQAKQQEGDVEVKICGSDGEEQNIGEVAPGCYVFEPDESPYIVITW